VLKFLFSIFSIYIWLNLMNTGDFNVNASFTVVFSIYFTLDLGFEEFGFLRVGKEGVRGFVLEDFVLVEGAVGFVFLF
jgi:hypothetical protein